MWLIMEEVGLEILSVDSADRPWLAEQLFQAFGSSQIVSNGILRDADRLPGWVARMDGVRAGFLCYALENTDMELVTLLVRQRRRGIGKSLIEKAVEFARENDAHRLWLVATNDNKPAHAFYDSCGFELREIREGAIAEARSLKPEIPETGVEGIPIEDEWIFELVLNRGPFSQGEGR